METSHRVSAVRVGLGLLFVGSGVMKYAVPRLREAWRGQLAAADVPGAEVAFWTVPAAETAAGVLLLANVAPRPVAGGVIGLMVGATYVHLVVDDPELFPLQPESPVVPAVVIAAAAYVIGRTGN